MKKYIIFSAILLSSIAHAENSEWRIYGPAFSHHNDLKGARITQPATSKADCTKDRYGMTCFEVADKTAVQEWSQNNPEIGIEFSEKAASGTGRDFYFASILRDSYSKIGLMSGIGRKWQIGQLGSFKISAGGAGGLWYRSTSEDRLVEMPDVIIPATPPYSSSPISFKGGFVRYESDLKRALVPFVLPVLSIEDAKTGLGFNVSYMPKVKIGGFYTVPTSTLMLQLTLKL
jgi:hypothetical protein